VNLRQLLPLAVISVLCLCEPAWAGKLLYWKLNKLQGHIELVTDEGVQPQAQFLADPARIIIDLPDTMVPKSKQRKKKRITKYIKEVRVGQFTSNTTRLVIELRSRYTVQPNDIKIRNLSPTRWFVQLPDFLPKRTVPDQGEAPIALAVPKVNSVARSGDSGPSIPVRAGAKVVIIDPGHGGGDPGAIGANGLQEKEIVLSVSKQVAAKLRRKGINAILTRTDDREIDLAPRVAQAERMKANVFVSIHANSISLSRPDINGLETYYYQSAEGRRLAKAIHSQILRNPSVKDRGVRQARFYVIRRTSMPAVLIEIGFVTGAQDAARLASPTQRTALAEAIAQGVLDYLR
jgi:N-acetylmuramoyl-L-alanine amidase